MAANSLATCSCKAPEIMLTALSSLLFFLKDLVLHTHVFTLQSFLQQPYCSLFQSEWNRSPLFRISYWEWKKKHFLRLSTHSDPTNAYQMNYLCLKLFKILFNNSLLWLQFWFYFQVFFCCWSVKKQRKLAFIFLIINQIFSFSPHSGFHYFEKGS